MASMKDLLNRGNNLFPIALVTLLALGDFGGAFTEGFPRGGLDEVAIPVVALAGIAWYWRNRYTRSLVPAAIIAGALAFKILAVLIEDKDDQGDDFGAAIVYILSLITWLVIYYRTRFAGERATRGQPALEEQPAAAR